VLKEKRGSVMSELIEVAKINELSDGSMKEVTAGGHGVLLARTDDKYFATAVRCPHMGGNLAKGKLEGTVVTCPRHGSQFDLSNGQVVRWVGKSGLLATLSKAIKQQRPLTTYNVVIKGDTILVEI
jgi:3-phenylpropionate/trans-cinnamate dioxygenase ferredoxin subunit